MKDSLRFWLRNINEYHDIKVMRRGALAWGRRKK